MNIFLLDKFSDYQNDFNKNELHFDNRTIKTMELGKNGDTMLGDFL